MQEQRWGHAVKRVQSNTAWALHPHSVGVILVLIIVGAGYYVCRIRHCDSALPCITPGSSQYSRTCRNALPCAGRQQWATQAGGRRATADST